MNTIFQIQPFGEAAGLGPQLCLDEALEGVWCVMFMTLTGKQFLLLAQTATGAEKLVNPDS